MNEFYTYAYLREDKTPYYIGKGTGNRIYSKSRRVERPKDKSKIIYLKKNLTEEEAFKHEIYMIAVFGRKDLGTGFLDNRTNGGDGICIKQSHTKVHRSRVGGRFAKEEKPPAKRVIVYLSEPLLERLDAYGRQNSTGRGRSITALLEDLL